MCCILPSNIYIKNNSFSEPFIKQYNQQFINIRVQYKQERIPIKEILCGCISSMDGVGICK